MLNGLKAFCLAQNMHRKTSISKTFYSSNIIGEDVPFLRIYQALVEFILTKYVGILTIREKFITRRALGQDIYEFWVRGVFVDAEQGMPINKTCGLLMNFGVNA